MPKDNRPPPDPAILELARAIARQMARDDFARGIRRLDDEVEEQTSPQLSELK